MTTSRDRRSLTDAQVRRVRTLGREGWTLHAIAKAVGTSATVACNIINGKAYNDIVDDDG